MEIGFIINLFHRLEWELIDLAFLRFLGWVFVPYIMIFFRWKRLRGVGKTFGVIWGVLALIMVISSAASNKSPQQTAAPVVTSSPDAATPPATKPAASPAPTPAPAPQGFKVGDTVKDGNLSFIVNSIKTADTIGDQYLNKKADGTFLILNVTVKNNDTKSRVLDNTMFKLASGSKSYDPDTEADVYVNSDTGFFLKQINPDISTTGNIVFDVPPDLKGEKLQVEDGFGWAGGKFQTIDLGQ